MLTKQMIQLISTYTIGCVATVCSDGAPAVSPKATFLVPDDQTIAFANIRSQGTVDNILNQPGVEVNFIDIFKRQGCRVRGVARYVPRDHAEADLRRRFEDSWPDLYPSMRGFVTITVTDASILTSPSYDIGAEAGDLVDQWLRRYAAALGYTVARRS